MPTTVQAKDAATCFDWGRLYGDDGITPASAGKTPPYWQHTISLNGGSCHVRGQPCHNVTPGSPTGKLPHYVVPSKVIASIKALGPGQWLTFQSYVLVKGTNPAYLHNTTRWDCRSRNPQLHWTNDNERYCYNDWKRIVQAVAARPDITVTNPVTVGVAFVVGPAFFLPPGAGPVLHPDVQTGPLARPWKVRGHRSTIARAFHAYKNAPKPASVPARLGRPGRTSADLVATTIIWYSCRT